MLTHEFERLEQIAAQDLVRLFEVSKHAPSCERRGLLGEALDTARRSLVACCEMLACLFDVEPGEDEEECEDED